MSFKSMIKKNRITRPLYMKYRSIKAEIAKKKSNEKMKSNGKNTLIRLQALLSKTNNLFFFDMGTLLGIVREGALLSHDIDIDVGVLIGEETKPENLRQYLIKNGCQPLFTFKVQKIGIVEESYLLNDVKFDIHYYYREGNSDVCYLLYRDPEKEYADKDTRSVVMLTCKKIDSITKRKCYNTLLNVPADAEAYLENRYGKNWRIPDKNYIYWKGNSARTTNLIGNKVEH